MAAKQQPSGMEVINKHIESGAFSNVYLMGGDEPYLLQQYKEKLVKALADTDDSMNYCIFKGENAKEDAIAEFAQTMPFFADRRVLLVEDSGFFKSGNEAMEKVLEELPDTTVIIFAEANIDKRNRLYKLVQKQGTVAMFSTPSEGMLLAWIKGLFRESEIAIDDKAVYRLLESTGSDMFMIYNEVEKLKAYCIERKHVSVHEVEELCVSQLENKIFEMMDAIALRNRERALSIYDDLLQLREPPMRILFLITRQYNILIKLKLALRDNKSYGELASIAKVPPFAIKNYVKQCEGYTYEKLLEILNCCQEADTNIKTGRYTDKLSVEFLIISLLVE